MARKITDEDLANRGVMGLPDVPGLTAIEMQKKLEEIPREVIIPRYNELVDSVADICEEFSKLNSYAVGDYCIYQNKLYKCNTATSGDWDASKWTETSVGDELKSVNSNLKMKKNGITNNVNVYLTCNTVCITIDGFTPSKAGTWTTIGTIMVESLRPPQTIYANAYVSNPLSNYGAIAIMPTGEVQIISSGVAVYGSVTYLVNNQG